MADVPSDVKMPPFADCDLLLEFYNIYVYFIKIKFYQIPFDKNMKFNISYYKFLPEEHRVSLPRLCDYKRKITPLRYDWYDDNGMPARTMSDFYYDEESLTYVLYLRSNTWHLKIWFEKRGDLLIPSTLFLPTFERGPDNQLPCKMVASQNIYYFPYHRPFPKRFYSGLFPTLERCSDDNMYFNDYKQYLEVQYGCLELLRAKQRLAFVKLALTDICIELSYDVIFEIGEHTIAELFKSSNCTIDAKDIMNKILINRDKKELALKEKETRRYVEKRKKLSIKNPRYKTSLCSFWYEDNCRKGVGCPYAHGVQDLMIDASTLSPDPLYKTQMCRHFALGRKCPYRHKCNFAHGKNDLLKLCRPC